MQGDEQAFQALISDLQSGKLSYAEAKQRYLALGETIRKQYELEVTAFSLDVVQSQQVKASGSPVDAEIAFDLYQRWVLEKLNQYGCRSYTWSGDGLMAMFTQPESAAAAAQALVDDLPRLNHRHALPRTIQIRIGIHTGPVLPHEQVRSGESAGLGRMASDTFDIAGHLQKGALPNTVAISEATYTHLGQKAMGFAPVVRELPNPGRCYVYPPLSAQPAPAYSDAPSLAHIPPSHTAAEPPSPLPVAWIASGAGALAVLIVVVAVLILHPFGGQATPVASGRLGQVPPAQPAAVQPAVPVPSGGSAAPAAAAANAPVAAPASAHPPAAPVPAPAATVRPIGSFGPERRVWVSPDAISGVPPRLSLSGSDGRWLLCIGVERYRDRAFSADGAEASARLMQLQLQTAYGIPAGHVQLLINESATGEGIKQAFQWLQSHAASGKDTVIVYLAGAASVAQARPDLRQAAGSDYVFFPADAATPDPVNTGLYGADLCAWLGAVRAQTVLVLADTSNAAALAAALPTNPDPGRQFVLLAATGAAQKLAPARPGQPSALADACAVALHGEADVDHDRRVSLEELRRYVQAEVPRRTSGAQTPDVRLGFGGLAVPELYLAGFR